MKKFNQMSLIIYFILYIFFIIDFSNNTVNNNILSDIIFSLILFNFLTLTIFYVGIPMFITIINLLINKRNISIFLYIIYLIIGIILLFFDWFISIFLGAEGANYQYFKIHIFAYIWIIISSICTIRKKQE